MGLMTMTKTIAKMMMMMRRTMMKMIVVEGEMKQLR
jgi:hypothetical protein